MIEDAQALIDIVRPLFAGYSPQVQSVALADLLAIWLAGHVSGEPDETRRWRAELLEQHCILVRQLTDINALFTERNAPWA